MLNLIKYEFIKKRKSLAVLYAMILILATYAGISILGEYEYHMALSLAFFGPICIFAPFYLWLDNISTYGKELKEKYSYMLYMTPNTPYKILGSKVIYIVGVTITTLAFEFLITTALYSVVRNKFTDFPKITDLLAQFNINISDGILPFCATIITLLGTLLLGYFCVTLSNTILSNKKLSGLLTFVLFIGLNWIISAITDKVAYLFSSGSFDWNTAWWISIGSGLIMIVGGYLLSGYLLDKKISL